MSILETQHLTYIYSKNTPYRKDAISDVSIAFEQEEVVGIIGQTGSGKSTLVRCLNGLLVPESGKVLFDGIDIQSEKAPKNLRFNVGLVFQYPEYQLFAENIYDDIAFGPKNKGIEGKELEELVYSSAEMVGLDKALLKNTPFELSGGEKRRAAIAGVVAMQPRVLILDEPTAGLDPEGRDQIYKMISKYRKDTGSTIVVVSHSMEDIAKFTDRVVVMNGGTVDMIDKTDKVFSDMKHLHSVGLDVPETTKIFIRLQKRGYDVPKNIYTPDDAVAYFKSRLNSEGNT